MRRNLFAAARMSERFRVISGIPIWKVPCDISSRHGAPKCETRSIIFLKGCSHEGRKRYPRSREASTVLSRQSYKFAAQGTKRSGVGRLCRDEKGDDSPKGKTWSYSLLSYRRGRTVRFLNDCQMVDDPGRRQSRTKIYAEGKIECRPQTHGRFVIRYPCISPPNSTVR